MSGKPLQKDDIDPQICSIDLRLEILQGLPFFSSLPSSEIESINRRFVERGYEAGETIYFAGDPVKHLFVVASGKVKLQRHSFAGKDVLIDLLIQGDFFGNLSGKQGEESAETAQAHTMSCVLSIGAGSFREILAQHPSVALRVLDIQASRLKTAHEQIRQLSVYTAEQRVAWTLLHLADKLGSETEHGLVIQTPLSRKDLAEMVGATTETVSRTISHFQHEDWVRSGRAWIAIRDREGLRQLLEDTTPSF